MFRPISTGANWHDEKDNRSNRNHPATVRMLGNPHDLPRSQPPKPYASGGYSIPKLNFERKRLDTPLPKLGPAPARKTTIPIYAIIKNQ